MYWDVASLPFTMGGMGLRCAELTSGAAYWSSWADCLEMIAARNPSVADMIVTQMNHEDAGFHVFGAAQVREQLVRVGFDAPNWHELRAGLRPPGQQVDERQVGIPGHGWQHEATQAVHAHLFATTIWPRLAPEERALIRSQGGPMSGVPFTCLPVSREARIESSSFRVLVLRRLWLPLLPSSRNCRCGLPLDLRGHHRAACAQVGVLGRRGFALESAAARVCREGGARVSTNVMLRAPTQDVWRLSLMARDVAHASLCTQAIPAVHSALPACPDKRSIVSELWSISISAQQSLVRWACVVQQCLQSERCRRHSPQMNNLFSQLCNILWSHARPPDGNTRSPARNTPQQPLSTPTPMVDQRVLSCSGGAQFERDFGQFLDVECLDTQKKWGPEGWSPEALKGWRPRRVEPRSVEP